jgi:hypothetical protein
MLASTHPLGERGRHNRYAITAVAFIVGSTAGGAVLGLAAGSVGSLLGRLVEPGPAMLAAAVVAIGVVGTAFDLHTGGLRLPTVRRQVNEDWLTTYRGWVYGVGFGFQLGLGVVTIVTTAAVYGAVALAVLTGSVWGGLAIGTTFGLARGLSILVAAGVRNPERLRQLHRGLDRRVRFSSTLAAATQGVLALAAATALIVR